MNFRYTFKTAFTSLKANKSRSSLTILGIVIGITAIMVIVSVGNGAEGLILGEVSGMGAQTIVVRPGKEPKGPSDMAGTLYSDSLKARDVAALKKKSNVPYLIDVAPALIVPGSVSYGGETYIPTIFGWTAKMMSEMLNIYPAEGVNFGENAIRDKASVAIIGSKVKKELFGASDAVGKRIKIRNKKFRVVGVYPPRGQVAFFNVDEVVIIPYTTAQTYLLGINYFNEIVTRAASPSAVARTVKDIEATIRETHGITDPSDDDFFVVTQEGVVNQIKNIMGVLTAFLSAVVAISLVVGGIGVMNIMLVSVTERTREIGLRKAIGATDGDILKQFLIESVILTALGGFIGVALGTFFSFLTSFVLTRFVGLDWSFSFPAVAMIMGLAVSAFVGLVFGIYPAHQAAKKNPIEALRYE
ncbi:MAG: FtsX-like permease family protein [bacterium]|nr:FtsX-like permease family protein [bacterium]